MQFYNNNDDDNNDDNDNDGDNDDDDDDDDDDGDNNSWQHCIKRQNGGCELAKLESTFNVAIVGLRKYIKQGREAYRISARLWHQGSQILLQMEGNLIKQKYKKQETAVQIIKNHCKSSIENKKIEELKSMDSSTGHWQTISRQIKSLVWLCSSGVKGEIESLIIAAQGWALNMCYQQKKIMRRPIDINAEFALKVKNT